jgi:hypothetical protein
MGEERWHNSDVFVFDNFSRTRDQLHEVARGKCFHQRRPTVEGGKGGRKEEERREDDLANLLQCLKKYSIVVSRDLVAEIRLTSNAITKTFSRDNCFSRKESASCASSSRKYFKLRPKIWSMFSCEDREGGRGVDWEREDWVGTSVKWHFPHTRYLTISRTASYPKSSIVIVPDCASTISEVNMVRKYLLRQHRRNCAREEGQQEVVGSRRRREIKRSTNLWCVNLFLSDNNGEVAEGLVIDVLLEIRKKRIPWQLASWRRDLNSGKRVREWRVKRVAKNAGLAFHLLPLKIDESRGKHLITSLSQTKFVDLVPSPTEECALLDIASTWFPRQNRGCIFLRIINPQLIQYGLATPAIDLPFHRQGEGKRRTKGQRGDHKVNLKLRWMINDLTLKIRNWFAIPIWSPQVDLIILQNHSNVAHACIESTSQYSRLHITAWDNIVDVKTFERRKYVPTILWR